MFINVLVSIRKSLWTQIKDDAKNDRIAKRFVALLSDNIDWFYGEPTKSGQKWALIDLQIKKGKIDELLEFLNGYDTSRWFLIGCWDNETGLQLGQRFREKANGTIEIVGTPTYPINKTELLIYLPPDRVYDANGNLISSTPKTTVQDCHIWLGMPPRNYA